MTITVALNHKTRYDFDRPVSLSPHVVRLRPAPHCRTPIRSYSLKIEPEDHFINWQQDPYGNFQARLVFPEKSRCLSVEVEVIADMTVINPFDFFIEEYAEEFPFKYGKSLKKELEPYLHCTTEGEMFTTLLESIPRKKKRTIDFLVDINMRLQQDVDYLVRMEPGVQTPEETLEKGKGSCRDSAWLMVQLLRHLGLAARFASGYLVQLKSDEKSLDGPSGPEADFTDLHAWCEVYLPGAGWVGLDPTSGLFASEGHIPLACTPEPSSAAPISGFTDECEVEFTFSNEVTRFHEDPRVTKPYTESEWEDALALGEKVDRILKEDDVRLTMGGEPTFVSIDDMESAQWNTEALGKDKLALAKTLLLRLRDHFAPKGLLHYGQGKWYPGEEVPRWALGLFWRTDGEPLWQDKDLLARVDKNYGHTEEDARVFARRLAELLNVPQRCAQPAFEDGLHYLLQEQNLPEDIDSRIATSKDSLERRRLARVLEQGLDTPTGYVLPLEWNFYGHCWQSSEWKFRRDRLTLIPGDSPMGLRLPLESLPAAEEDPLIQEADPHRETETLETAEAAVKEALARNNRPAAQAQPLTPSSSTPPVQKQSAQKKVEGNEKAEPAAKKDDYRWKNLVRTALGIEARDGKLHLFLPPLPYLESYVNLLALIERTAMELDLPVIIEGYEPPKDHRMQKLLVTPDPGVIEVNIHPSDNWADMVSNMTELYKAAKESRLSTEKCLMAVTRAPVVAITLP